MVMDKHNNSRKLHDTYIDLRWQQNALYTWWEVHYIVPKTYHWYIHASPVNTH